MRLPGDLLPVAGLVVGDAAGRGFCLGLADSDFRKEFVNVLKLCRLLRGLFVVGGIAFKEAAIGFEMGSATTRVRNDGDGIFQIKRIDQSARKVTGRFQFAIVGMERTATKRPLGLLRSIFAAS